MITFVGVVLILCAASAVTAPAADMTTSLVAGMVTSSVIIARVPPTGIVDTPPVTTGEHLQ